MRHLPVPADMLIHLGHPRQCHGLPAKVVRARTRFQRIPVSAYRIFVMAQKKIEKARVLCAVSRACHVIGALTDGNGL